MTHQFKLDMFEGPLDLLLHLIKEHKMDIHDIPIAEITRQYMDVIQLMEELNLELTGEYLVMAAELTRIKSKVLLPVHEQEPEAGEEGQDPRAELMRRLQEYQRYKDAAFELRVREYDRQQVFVRGGDVLVDEDSGEEIIVGVNNFKHSEEEKRDVLKISAKIEDEQIRRLKLFKENREQKAILKCLEKISAAATGNDNLMPLFVEAVENHTTLGEISDTLRKVFGQHKETITI
ncbi:MAG: segregation/condensation protein A [Nitrospinae bacterium]|nr:segregation/condensation protein A [Nitrospinota bacterium]